MERTVDFYVTIVKRIYPGNEKEHFGDDSIIL